MPASGSGRGGNVAWIVQSGLVWGLLGLWLLPLAAMALTSVPPLADITHGNYWGWPSRLSLVENYTVMFRETPLALYTGVTS